MPLFAFSKAPYEIDPLFFSSPNSSNSYLFESYSAPLIIINGSEILLEFL